MNDAARMEVRLRTGIDEVVVIMEVANSELKRLEGLGGGDEVLIDIGCQMVRKAVKEVRASEKGVWFVDNKTLERVRP